MTSLRKSGCETMIGHYLDILSPIFKMQITRASDYAVRVMVHLASLSEEKKVPLTALVHATGVKESFLSKVLQRLVHTGLCEFASRDRRRVLLESASGEDHVARSN